MSKSYVVSTDRVFIKRVGLTPVDVTLEWITPEREAEVAASKDTPFRMLNPGEFLYWNGHARTMTGVVEDADVFETVDAAESAAFLAATLDPSLAGHLHVTEKDVAFGWEKPNIEERAREKARYKEFMENRYKLGGGEGGGI